MNEPMLSARTSHPKLKRFTRRQLHVIAVERIKERAKQARADRKVERFIDRGDRKVDSALRGCEDW